MALQEYVDFRITVALFAEGLCVSMPAAVVPEFEAAAFHAQFLTASVAVDGRRFIITHFAATRIC